MHNDQYNKSIDQTDVFFCIKIIYFNILYYPYSYKQFTKSHMSHSYSTITHRTNSKFKLSVYMIYGLSINNGDVNLVHFNNNRKQ